MHGVFHKTVRLHAVSLFSVDYDNMGRRKRPEMPQVGTGRLDLWIKTTCGQTSYHWNTSRWPSSQAEQGEKIYIYIILGQSTVYSSDT